MEATELRIGNLVSLNGKEHKVSAQCLYEGTNEYFEPIPLTEELMLSKFGAKKTRNGFLYKDIYVQHIQQDIWYTFRIRNLWGDRIKQFYADIKFLHQWQNLYFALEEKELIFKNQQ